MRELIDKKATIKALMAEYRECSRDGEEMGGEAVLMAEGLDSAIDIVRNAPTIDPVKHEYWIGYDTTAYTGCDDFGEPIFTPRRFYRCHGCRIGTVVKSNYCPNCGARMDADEVKP